MAVAKDHFIEETQIREVMDTWKSAFEAKDLERIMSLYADDVVAFDMMPPLKFAGKEAYRKAWEEGLRQMEGPYSIETLEHHIVVDEETAYSYSIGRFRGEREGKDFEMVSRVTDCFRKMDGKWLITHEHASVPLDMQTGKGLMDLKP